MKRLLTLLVALFAITSLWATEPTQHHPLFKEGDKVCFVGNSITHAGQYVKYIMEYYTTRYPSMRLHFRNKGCAGDQTAGVLARMDLDILRTDPDVAILMIGMNDVKRALYTDPNIADSTKRREIAERYDYYTTNIDQICEVLSKNSRELVLLTPSIYDQTSVKPRSKAGIGINDGLYSYGEYIKANASRYGAHVVDIWAKSNAVNLELQKDNPAASFTGGDRIHPSYFGGFIMASKFIKDIEEPSLVSMVAIDKKGVVKESQRASVSNLTYQRSKVEFDLLAEGLPLALDEAANNASKYNSFKEDYNREIISIEGLTKGRYRLSIDGKEVGEYSHTEFESGINLSANNLTPQYQQSERISKLYRQINSKYSDYRNFALVEHRILSPDFELYIRPDAVIAELHERLKTEERGYYKKKYNYYIKNRHLREVQYFEILKMLDQAYDMAQPKSHRYSVEQIK